MSNTESVKLDDREIQCIGWWFGSDLEIIQVGAEGITKIDCVEQFCGEYSIHWLQVWKENKIVARYNARNVDSVYYEESWYG